VKWRIGRCGWLGVELEEDGLEVLMVFTVAFKVVVAFGAKVEVALPVLAVLAVLAGTAVVEVVEVLEELEDTEDGEAENELGSEHVASSSSSSAVLGILARIFIAKSLIAVNSFGSEPLAFKLSP